MGKHQPHNVIYDVISCGQFSKVVPIKDHCKGIVKIYYETKSPITAIRTMHKRYPNVGKLDRKQIHRTVKQFEVMGSTEYGRHNNMGRPKSVWNEATIEQVKAVITETPRKSVRMVFGDITNIASHSSVYRMLKYDLKLTPYKISIMQHLKPTDIESRLSFARWVTENEDIVGQIWFSDEAHFYLNAQVNKKNAIFWGNEKPEFYIESK